MSFRLPEKLRLAARCSGAARLLLAETLNQEHAAWRLSAWISAAFNFGEGHILTSRTAGGRVPTASIVRIQSSYTPPLTIRGGLEVAMTRNDSPYDDVLSARLQRITTELREVQQLLMLEGVDSHILLDFRESVDSVRHVAWAAQHWLEHRNKRQEVANVLEFLTMHRLRVTRQMCTDLIMGFREHEWDVSSEGALDLFTSARALVQLMSGRSSDQAGVG